MSLNITPARSDADVELVKELAKLDKHTTGALSPMNINPDAIKKGWIVLAREGKTPVGFLVVRHCVRNPWTSLYYIGVHPDHRGKGYGEELIWWLMDDSPHDRIRLVCETTNVKSNEFYKIVGFSHRGVSVSKSGTENNIWILEEEESDYGPA